MAKALVGGMRQANIGPNVLRTAAHAGVLVDRRNEAGVGSKYMKGLGEWVLQREAYLPPQEESVTNKHPIEDEDSEEILLDASAAADKVLAELVELDLDVEEAVPV
ncbi:MAG: hypothetical protein ACREGB_03705 [Candidatus Saccharimonadales bacterium]